MHLDVPSRVFPLFVVTAVAVSAIRACPVPIAVRVLRAVAKGAAAANNGMGRRLIFPVVRQVIRWFAVIGLHCCAAFFS